MRLAPKENFRCPFKYQGQYYDSEVELCYNRFRYYHPETGRYIGEDPIKLLGGFNVFAYVGDTNAWVDLLGLDSKHNHRNIKDVDAMDDIDKFLGNGEKTNIHPRKKTEDKDRIFAQQPDGTWHAVRIGDHEMRKDIGKGFHYHLEKFDENGVFIGPDEMVNVIKTKRNKYQ